MFPNNYKYAQRLNIFLHIGFFFTGITTVIIGQILPIIANRFNLNDLQLSYCFPAQFSGSIAGTLWANKFGLQNKFITASFLGFILMAIGIWLLNLGSFELCLLGFFLNGIGVGLTLPSINMLILEINRHRSTSALNLLNFFWGLGAIFCSLSIPIFYKMFGLFFSTSLISIPLLLIAVLVILTPNVIEEKTEKTAVDDVPQTPIWTNPIAWLIAFFNFIHVGVESGIGGWLAIYSERLDGKLVVWWLAPTFLFFLFFVVGRGVASIFSRFLDENKMLILGLFTVLIGLGCLLVAKDNSFLSIGAAISGFGNSWIFPTNLSRFTKTFGESSSRRATPFFVCGTLGAIFTTWLIGFISNQYNSLHFGMFVLLGSIIGLIVLQLYLLLKQKM